MNVGMHASTAGYLFEAEREEAATFMNVSEWEGIDEKASSIHW
jgi:hypothetical protein